ncbi:BTAD domain-containing protein [Tessaracoccus defluvii]|uniref:Bacterial transcriptional activator domain-containing protein n=1 Tax=Tessaracoccus defluvii TaxID=1285901 RepID=A0A7H0H4I6_9ACTN|nr:BTAD domain-containing protein [Tessaracoccus defluvii]QNP55452.1 hypothetical protein H9L22_14810 [Tessaracoccus defluvii]
MSASMRFSLHFSGSEVFQQSRAARTLLDELDADDHAERARLLAILTAASVFFDPQAAASAAADAAAAAERAGDGVSRAWALIASSVSDLSCATTEQRLEMTREVIQISMDTGEAAFLPMSFFLHLAALAELGRMSELDLALSPVGPILGHFPELKDGRHVTWFRCFQAMLRGDVRDAEQLAQQGLAVSQADDPDAQAVYVGQLAIIRWMQGRVVELEPLFLQVRQAAPHEPVWAVCLAWMWLKQGRTSAARSLVAALPPVAELPIDRNWLSTLCILTEVAHQLHQTELARDLYAALVPYQDRLMTVGLGIAFWGTVARPLALAARTMGDTGLAISHYRHGIEVASRCGAHPWLAELQWELARLLGDQADEAAHDEAVALAVESLATAQALHLHTTEEMASRTLAALRSASALRQRSSSVGTELDVARARIQVFSGFVVTSVDGSEGRWQSRKARQMLKILIARRGTAMSRGTLMDMLWPDVPPHQLTNRFSVAAAAVRRALDPSSVLERDAFLGYRDGLIQLRIDALDIDAEQFLTTAESALAEPATATERIERLSAALSLYTGEPLQEEQSELWAADFRREIHEVFFSAAHTLAELFAAEGDHLSRLETYRRVLALDEFDQRAHEGVISSLTELGAHGRADAAREEYVRTVGSLGVPLGEALVRRRD